MKTMRLITDPDAVVDEMVEGMLAAHPRHLRRAEGHRRALAADRGAGVLYLYGNYAGDYMNFDMAAEMAGMDGIEVRTVLTIYDVASAPRERRDERRGVAGNAFVFKVAGAAADAMMSLDEVERLARRAVDRTFTVGVALSPCSLPQTLVSNFEIGEGEMEVGMGIHGEPGIERAPLRTARPKRPSSGFEGTTRATRGDAACYRAIHGDIVPRTGRGRPMSDGGRLPYLDGLRGLAAAQVVLRHYLSAFLPGLGQFAARHVGLGAPWLFVSDAAFWMCLFFTISGAVLTTAQQKHPLGLGPSIVERLVRLGGPMAVALTCSALLMSAAPRIHAEAALLSGPNPWMAEAMNTPGSVAEIVRQALSTGMLTGYRETTLLPRGMVEGLALDPIARSLDPVLWTLHIELWGSILVLSLAALRRRLSGRAYAVLLAPLAIVLSRHVFLAFLFGHVLAVVRSSPWWRSFQGSSAGKAAGLLSLLLGVVACADPRWGWMTAWFALPNPLPIVPGLNSQGLYAAIAFVVGVTLLPPMRAVLAWPALRWLGRNSFGLYLFHLPILFTASSAVFVALDGRASYGTAVLGAAAVGVPLSLAAATAFTAWIAPPFVRLGRALAGMRLPRGRRLASAGEVF